MTYRAEMFTLGSRLIGTAELPGGADHPMIQWGHMLCGLGADQPDEVPWCSSFVNLLAHLAGVPETQRSRSAAARSWLGCGVTWTLYQAELGDVVVLQRGTGSQPGPEVLNAPGHTGLYAGVADGVSIKVLGGNQGDRVSIANYPVTRILGIRRL